MAAIGVAQGPLALIGREREVMAIGGVLDRALTGEAGALVVRGEAGIGKSALLAYACARAGGMTILRATGVEAESDLAFAGLYGLARPVLDKLDELPVTQRDALAGALGLAPSTGADRLLVSAAVLSLLAAAAEECPVLCVIDDAQWFDRPSADALVFSARRLRAERLVMLFGAREGDAQRFEVTDLPEMVIEGLDGRSARPGLVVAPTSWHRRSGSGCWRRPRGTLWRCWSCPRPCPPFSWPGTRHYRRRSRSRRAFKVSFCVALSAYHRTLRTQC